MKSVTRIAVTSLVALTLSAGVVMAATPAQAACGQYSGYVCIYRDHGGAGPQRDAVGGYSNYANYKYSTGNTTLNETASRFENRSSSGTNKVKLYYHTSGVGYFGCVNPGSTWDLPGGGWGDKPGDSKFPDDNTSSHSWQSGASASCA